MYVTPLFDPQELLFTLLNYIVSSVAISSLSLLLPVFRRRGSDTTAAAGDTTGAETDAAPGRSELRAGIELVRLYL